MKINITSANIIEESNFRCCHCDFECYVVQMASWPRYWSKHV